MVEFSRKLIFWYHGVNLYSSITISSEIKSWLVGQQFSFQNVKIRPQITYGSVQILRNALKRVKHFFTFNKIDSLTLLNFAWGGPKLKGWFFLKTPLKNFLANWNLGVPKGGSRGRYKTSDERFIIIPRHIQVNKKIMIQMLLILTLFIVCTLPSRFADISMDMVDFESHHVYLGFQFVAYVLYTLQGALNPLMYSLQVSVHIFCLCIRYYLNLEPLARKYRKFRDLISRFLISSFLLSVRMFCFIGNSVT